MIVIGEVVRLRETIQWFEWNAVQQAFPIQAALG